MARLPRLLLAGYPLHILQRGHNRQAVFLNDADRKHYLGWLRDAAREYRVAVHAYVLMDTHAHLLVTPETADGLGRMMQSLGRRYTQYFNQCYARSGTLWEGRYKSSLLDPDAYVLPCARYIELNPVRCGWVGRPEDYPWSSYRQHAGLATEAWLTDPTQYWALGNTPFERQSAWRAWVAEGAAAQESRQLTDSVLKGWALGTPVFLAALEKLSNRRASPLPKGRPAAQTEADKKSADLASEP